MVSGIHRACVRASPTSLGLRGINGRDLSGRQRGDTKGTEYPNASEQLKHAASLLLDCLPLPQAAV